MAQPYGQQKLSVIICDPNYEIRDTVRAVLNHQAKSRYSSFYVEFVDNIDTIRLLIERGKPPQYAGVFYSTSVIGGKARTIGSISSRDRFLPQIVVQGQTAVAQEILSAANGAGAKEYVRNETELEKLLLNRFRVPSFVKNGSVLKIGGSSFDYEDDMDDPALGTYCDALVDIFRDSTYEKQRIICTVGAGRRGDIVKRLRSKYTHRPRVQEQYPKRIVAALEQNLDSISDLLTPEHSSLHSAESFYHINKNSLDKKIQLIGVAPHWMMVRDSIPLEDSDTHTVALAELYGMKRVVLLKRTDGIYTFDPMRGYTISSNNTCADPEKWKQEQMQNKRYQTVTVDELRDLSREGTGRDGAADGTTGHLMEDSALEYFKECKHVEEILIIHIAPQEMYLHQSGVPRHIVTEEIPSFLNWNVVRAQSLRDAIVHGKAYSKIVR